MLSPETSKRRSARISLDHFRASDRVAVARFWLSAAASALSVAWLSGLGWDVRDWGNAAERSRVLASHGPLASAHSSLETACDACHVPFAPIDGAAWTAGLVADTKGSDAKCRSCHAGGGHQSAARPDDVASCAACHSDHRGREASLLAVPDADCTRCHAATDQHMLPGIRPRFATSIERFDADPGHHPEFALFRDGPPKDPGRLKFNHALHMSPGFNAEAGGRPLKTLADLTEPDRAAYRGPGQSEADAVQLRCDSCHQLDVDHRSSPAGTTPGTGGAYMRPIRYDKDCRACHTLDFDPALPAIRHGLQPAEVDEALWQAYSAKYLRDRPAPPEPGTNHRPIPGRAGRAEARDAIAEDVARAGRVLSGEKR